MSTIVAISTPPGNGGIGIVRMSGKEAFNIIEKIFVSKNKSEIKDMHQLFYDISIPWKCEKKMRNLWRKC